MAAMNYFNKLSIYLLHIKPWYLIIVSHQNCKDYCQPLSSTITIVVGVVAVGNIIMVIE